MNKNRLRDDDIYLRNWNQIDINHRFIQIKIQIHFLLSRETMKAPFCRIGCCGFIDVLVLVFNGRGHGEN